VGAGGCPHFDRDYGGLPDGWILVHDVDGFTVGGGDSCVW
jgi:hypothetical protein